MGNTPSIATRHYLIPTDAHFAAAMSENEVAQKAAHNPAQQALATGRGDAQPASAAHKKPWFCQGSRVIAVWCNYPR
jgi:hypothetical protein